MTVVSRSSSPVSTTTTTPKSKANPSSITPRKRAAKSHVSAACVNCQKAHLACDMERPCRRCVHSGREDTCLDVQHKKRGRPRRRARESSQTQINHHVMTNFIPPPEQLYSSFAMTEQADTISSSSNSLKNCQGMVDQHVITLFLSMDVCCARVSDESLDLLGLYPHEFAHRTLYDFIQPDHAKRLARVHRRLLENANHTSGGKCIPPTKRTTADCFTCTPAIQLLSIANGSQTLKETLGFKTSGGSHVVMDARFYLGGGLGADLFQSDTLEHLYIVCLATMEKKDPLTPTPAAATATTSAEAALTSLLLNHSPLVQPSPSPTLIPLTCQTPETASSVNSLLLHEDVPSILGMSPSPILLSNPSEPPQSIVPQPFIDKDLVISQSALLWLDPWMTSNASEFDLLELQA